MVRTLRPFHSNIKKRLVKSPKIYIRDSGILHYLLGIDQYEQLAGNPKMGASWEGFVIEQLMPLIPLNRQVFFYRTHDGAELDMVISKGGIPVSGIEIKYGSDVRLSRGNTQAIQTLQTTNNFVLIKDREDYAVSKSLRVCDVNTFADKYLPGL